LIEFDKWLNFSSNKLEIWKEFLGKWSKLENWSFVSYEEKISVKRKRM